MDITELETLLEQERACFAPQTRAAYDESVARRNVARRAYIELSTRVAQMERSVRTLPDLAPEGLVRWAESALQMFNLSFVVIDTTSLADDADILRILITDGAGEEAYHGIIRPLRQPNQPNTYYTGLTQAHLDHASTLADEWQRITEALTGAFVVAYNLEFVQQHLDESARHYGLNPIHLIGACLQQKACRYFESDYSISLPDACKRIGHAMPDRFAHARVQAQVALLRAMAQGINQVPTHEEDEDALAGLDEHPF